MKDGGHANPVAPATAPQGVPAPTHPDWLRHALTLTGPAFDVAAFQAEAHGPSAIPWHRDPDDEEMRLLVLMTSSGASARGLARDLREQVAQRQDRVHAAAARSGGDCPLDLHRLVPIPNRILQLGCDAPQSRLWLWTHWGTLWPLRHVRVLDDLVDGRLKRSARVAWEFWSADWTPWQALVRLRQDWPSLMFDLRPDYGDAADATPPMTEASPRSKTR